MSLEQAIQDNTIAIEKLIKALGSAVVQAPTEKIADEPVTKKKTAATKKKTTETKKDKTESDISYDTVKIKALDFIETFGRKALLEKIYEIDESYKTAKDIQQDEYKDFIESMATYTPEEK